LYRDLLLLSWPGFEKRGMIQAGTVFLLPITDIMEHHAASSALALGRASTTNRFIYLSSLVGGRCRDRTGRGEKIKRYFTLVNSHGQAYKATTICDYLHS
jgi:hypothetical protein